MNKLRHQVLYYAHSKRIYDTEEEKQEIKQIDKFFSNALVINPNGCIIQDISEFKIMEQCFKIIDTLCTTLVFTSIEDGYIGKGVYTEILEAKKNKLEIYYLNNNEIKNIDIDKNIKVCDDTGTWAKYAKVNLS